MAIIKIFKNIYLLLICYWFLANEIGTLCQITFRTFKNWLIFLIIYIWINFTSCLYWSIWLFFCFLGESIRYFFIWVLISLILWICIIILELFSFILTINCIERIFRILRTNFRKKKVLKVCWFIIWWISGFTKRCYILILCWGLMFEIILTDSLHFLQLFSKMIYIF